MIDDSPAPRVVHVILRCWQAQVSGLGHKTGGGGGLHAAEGTEAVAKLMVAERLRQVRTRFAIPNKHLDGNAARGERRRHWVMQQIRIESLLLHRLLRLVSAMLLSEYSTVISA